MQSEMSRARYASSRGKDSLNYRVVAATKASGDGIRVGIVFQEYIFEGWNAFIAVQTRLWEQWKSEETLASNLRNVCR